VFFIFGDLIEALPNSLPCISAILVTVDLAGIFSAPGRQGSIVESRPGR